MHVYSDVPALAIKQAGHSKDFTRRQYPGTYSLVSIVPLLDLWPQAIATGDVLAFVSKPTYDPNLFIDGIDPVSWKELNDDQDKPLLNRPRKPLIAPRQKVALPHHQRPHHNQHPSQRLHRPHHHPPK